MFSITAKFKEHSIKFRILVIVLPVVILSYIILLSSFYMIYVKESRNNILLEHEENTLSIAKNTASYFSSLNFFRTELFICIGMDQRLNFCSVKQQINVGVQ